LVIPTSAEIELALKKAQKAGLIKYDGKSMEILDESSLNDAQKNALNYMKSYLDKFGGTGIQDLINVSYFDLLNMIVVYPVEDEGKFCDKKGNVLPDAYLVKKGATAKDLAFKIHTEIGQKFIYAVDAKKKLRISADQELNDGDIIKIVSAA